VREVEVREPPAFDAARVQALRRKIGLSQAAFAYVVGGAPVTIQKWEQGKLKPNPMARRLMGIIESSPRELTDRIVTMKRSKPHGSKARGRVPN
jgi:putative transcriptional regulator